METNKVDEDKNNMHKKGTKKTITYELNPSSQVLFEDTLKRCINKYNGSRAPIKTKYAPRNKQSPFGDFPSSYLPKRLQFSRHRVASSRKFHFKFPKCEEKQSISSNGGLFFSHKANDR